VVGVYLLDRGVTIIKHLGYFLRAAKDIVGGAYFFNFPDDDAEVADFWCIDFAEIVDYFNDIERLNCLRGVGVLSRYDSGAWNGIGTYKQAIKESFLIRDAETIYEKEGTWFPWGCFHWLGRLKLAAWDDSWEGSSGDRGL
jgi:hypothetical protein